MTTRAVFATQYASKSVAWMRDTLELSNREIGEALGTSSRTVIRWYNRESCPSPSYRNHLEDFAVLRQLLSEAFRTREALHQWLGEPVPALKGRTPLSMILDGNVDSVIELLGTLLAGAFV